ncbi:uncharacterized protein RCH25_017857 [Pelodytes ibericus]
MNKMKNDEDKTEVILNYALEIIYMLTGEEYSIVKKRPRRRKSNIHLVTGEVPIKCDDVAMYFTKEEWEYLQAHKERYQDVIKTNQQSLSNIGFVANCNSATHSVRSTGIPKFTLLTPQSRHRILKRTRLNLPSSMQFNQLVHSIANLGRRVAKIDRNISHMLKEFEKNNATFEQQLPEDHYDVPDKLSLQTHFKEDEVLFADCQDQMYQPAQASPPLSSFGPLSYSQDIIDPFSKMSASTLPIIESSLNSPTFTVRSETSEHSQTHSPCTADSNGETLPDTPPSTMSVSLQTSAKTSSSAVITGASSDKTTSFGNQFRIAGKKQAHHDNSNTTDSIGEVEQDLQPSPGLTTARTATRISRLAKSSTIELPSVKGPAFIVVSKILEEQQAHMESLRTPDCLGDPLPDIPLATMTAGLLNNFKMQSRGQPHRYAQLLFQHHVPYSVYKTWTHNTNYDGSRGKHALPKNLKRLIINETSAAFKLTPPVLKKIKDTLNGLLRIPRTGGWDSNSNFV